VLETTPGADVVQFDEPCFNVYVDKVEAWGIEALERCCEGAAIVPREHGA
jgi:5-methyltetrahydropteroyltriglutamate--homocysteine methyltransferase